MGRFATTVPFYEKLRPPYPAEFFRTVSARLGLSKAHRLIDLGTGPGLLAIGFAPYVGRIVGVDPEPAMLAEARKAAERTGQELTLVESKAEALPREIGRFDVVTIGRALHWLEPDATAGLFERLMVPGGVIVVCSANSAADGRNAWFDVYSRARRNWSGVAEGERYGRQVAMRLAGTRFRVGETIAVESSHDVRVEELAQRMLTFSSSSPAVLGNKVEAMLRDVEQGLRPFSRDGMLHEVVVSTAQLVR
jgi:ubiquinone/menaquinone biosynthesis C-methylase UbiE